MGVYTQADSLGKLANPTTSEFTTTTTAFFKVEENTFFPKRTKLLVAL
jgi:hypothetical protein